MMGSRVSVPVIGPCKKRASYFPLNEITPRKYYTKVFKIQSYKRMLSLLITLDLENVCAEQTYTYGTNKSNNYSTFLHGTIT
jgi:hypothetical protein